MKILNRNKGVNEETAENKRKAGVAAAATERETTEATEATETTETSAKAGRKAIKRARKEKKAEAVETVSEAAAKETTKEKKHKKLKLTKKRIIALASTVVVLLFIVTRTISAAAAASTFDAATVKTGSLVSTVELSGSLESKEIKSFYSEIDGKIGNIAVSEGDAVKKGDVLISYDAEDLQYRTEAAALDARLKEENYTDKVQANDRVAGLYSEAAGSLKSLDEQILIYQAAILQIDDEIEKKKAALADEGANLQISLIDWADEPYSEEYENLQKQVQRNTYEQSHNKDLVEMETTRRCYQENLSDCKQKKAEMESQKKSSYTSMMTKAGKESLETSKEADELATGNTAEKLDEAGKGIISDINGVVTKVYTKEGSTEAQGRELITVESTDNMVVRFRVGKYDIENLREGQEATVTIRNKDYSGKISKIDKKVTKDEKGSNGVSMEITLDSPDEDIILGLEAKARIDALSRDNVLMIPKGAIYSDTEGEYVYAAENGKAVRKPVEVGIYNSEDIEIRSGLNEGDKVIIAGENEITEGMDIKANMIDED